MRINSSKSYGGLLLGIALAICLSPLNTRANDIEPGKEFYTAIQAGGPIVLDGSLADWAGVPVLADPKFSIPKGSGDNGTLVLFEEYAGGTWTGPDDHTSAVQVVWDVNNVYFGFVVTDDYHENSANSAWNGDSVQLMIANADRNQQVALYNYALGGIEGELGDVIVMHEAGPGGTEAVVTRDAAAKKTYYEIKLPVESLGLTSLSAGTKFGLGMAINDGDEAAGQNGQKGWGGLGAHSIVFGKTPSETALVTLSAEKPGSDRLFFSAINTAIDSFSFRATDKGASIVDPASAKVTIDGTVVTLTSRRSGDAVDFTYTPATAFPPNSDHTYVIEVKDTAGNTVSETGSFKTPLYALLTPDDKVTADTTKPGFVFNVHQNSKFAANNNTRPLLQLAGLLGENFADPAAQSTATAAGTRGANNRLPIRFEIPTVINFEQDAVGAGDFQPDDPIPGIPGTDTEGDPSNGIAGEIITYLELPAGKHTLIVNSDDGFRTTAGRNANDALLGQVAGQFEGGRGAADTSYTVFVQEAGVYPFRTVWQEGGGGANIEWKSLKADGTKVLINDTANGGIKAYRATTTSLPAFVKAVSPAPGQAMLGQPAKVEAVLTDAGTQIDAGSVAMKINGATVTATANKASGDTTVSHTTSGLQPSTDYNVELTFTAGGTARTVNWTFKTGPLSAGIFVIEAEDFDYDSAQTNPQKGVQGMDVDKMPYLGGAYVDLSAVEGIDFVNGDGFDSDQYRQELGDDGDHEVNITGSNNQPPGNGLGGTIPIGSNDRGFWTVESNFRIGWVASGEWQNYTRVFPDNGVGGWWKVYAGLSFGGNSDGQMVGSLAKVTSGVGTDTQETEVVGSFNAPGSGAWGANNLVPMKNASGDDALVKLTGKNTVRFNLGSGDFDFLIFVPAPPPPPFVSKSPIESTKRNEVVADWELRDTDSKVNVSTLKLFVAGQDRTSSATVTKTDTGATVRLDLTGTTLDAGVLPWRITFNDSSNQAVTAEGSITVNPYPTEGVFVIEAEDFNYSDDGVAGGKFNPQKGVEGLDVDKMPYLGGAYADLSAVEGVDYNNGDAANDGNTYRTELDENGENEVAVTSSTGNRYSNDRGVFETEQNYRIGWVSSGDWQNYTRTFPAGTYSVWAALSHGNAAGGLSGSLDLVTSDPTKPNQTTERLGTFSGTGTGGWGRNDLVPMRDADGKVTTVTMGGVQTVRFNLGSGDFDYLVFAPATATPGGGDSDVKITGIRRNANGSITLEWTGGGTLQSAPSVTGPWTDVAGASSPFTFTPTENALFGRIRR